MVCTYFKFFLSSLENIGWKWNIAFSMVIYIDVRESAQERERERRRKKRDKKAKKGLNKCSIPYYNISFSVYLISHVLCGYHK